MRSATARRLLARLALYHLTGGGARRGRWVEPRPITEPRSYLLLRCHTPPAFVMEVATGGPFFPSLESPLSLYSLTCYSMDLCPENGSLLTQHVLKY
ncbi:hypothetical protein J6590_035509 [Homalodisca vitripennis]|nr:hypothetical protein J6590_035509 [Homalodisca vitripennis]